MNRKVFKHLNPLITNSMVETRIVVVALAVIIFLVVGAYWILTPQGFCAGSIWDCFNRKQPISLAGIQLFGAYITVVLVLIFFVLFWLFQLLRQP